MAGIDNNTVLYLRGDSFKDLSLSPKTITNSGASINTDSIMFNGSSSYLSISDSEDFNFENEDFTIEFDVYLNALPSYNSLSVLGHRSAYNSNHAYTCGFGNNGFEFSYTTNGTTQITNYIPLSNFSINVFYNIAICRKDNNLYIFLNGTKKVSTTITGTVFNSSADFKIGAVNSSVGGFLNGKIKNLCISNGVARYTKDFTPPTQPYNSITIDTLSQTATNVNFSVTKLGQETINKVEVLQDNEVKDTYTEGYDNLIYNFEGSNDVTIRVTYDDNYTEEKTIKVGNSKAKIYLYKEGNECVSLTGGWKLGRSNGSPTRNKNENNLEIKTSTTGHDGAFVTTNAINISKFSKMNSVLDCKNYRGRIIITDDSTGNNNSNSVMWQNDSASDNFTNKEVSVDFNIDNNRYFSIMSYAQQNSEQITRVRKIWLETKENVLTINSHEDSKITFSANDLGLVTINKIDVLVNGVVSKTYTDEYLNLSYIVDKSLCYIGNNNIEIRVTYSQGDDITETVSEYLTYKYDVSQLPLETPLLDTVERVKLLTKSKQNEKNMLSSILTTKNVEVTEEDKMSDLIGKVDLLDEYDNPILYIYKDGVFNENYTRTPLTNSSNNSIIEYGENSFTLKGITSSYWVSRLAFEKVDFTSYSKLYVECSLISGTSQSSKNATINVNSVIHKETLTNPLGVEFISAFSRGVKVLDVSNINGVYYLNLTTYDTNLTIYNIWLEK